MDDVPRMIASENDETLIQIDGFWVRRENESQDRVVINDVFHGDCYRTSLFGNTDIDELVVDVGAHIGAFAKLWHRKNPKAKIICIEACPENIPALLANVGSFATVIHAACTYELDNVGLLNAVYPNCVSTGGSIVVPLAMLSQSGQPHDNQYYQDARPLAKITLEEVLAIAVRDRIEILKLDCEGSEFSILGKTPSLTRIRSIFAEYHGWDRFLELQRERFRGWDFGQMASGVLGIVHLANPNWPPPTLPIASV